MALHVKPGTEWSAVLSRASDRAPEAFGADVLHNLVGGSWQPIGTPERLTSPVDGSELIGLPTLDPKQASEAVRYAADAHAEWGAVPLADRKARVGAAVEAMGRAGGAPQEGLRVRQATVYGVPAIRRTA